MSEKVAYTIDMRDPAVLTRQRTEIAERQALVASWLAQTNTDQLVLLEPPNLNWFVGAPLCRGIVDVGEQPVLIIAAQQRWVVCSSVDSQRLFDLFLDGLGFQLKEWPWQCGRDQLLADLCENKYICCDRLMRDAASVADRVREARLVNSSLTQLQLLELGRDVAHALEATGRAAEPGAHEAELAGQLAHRLAHRGIEIVTLCGAGDGRDMTDSRPTPDSLNCQHSCVLSVMARRDGVHVGAARTIWFDDAPVSVRHDYEIAGQIMAARIAMMSPGAAPATLFDTGQRVAKALHCENAWHDLPFGYWTGRLPIERTFNPKDQSKLVSGNSVVLATRANSATSVDTFLVTDTGVEWLTRDPEGPTRRFRIGERTIELPAVLSR